MVKKKTSSTQKKTAEARARATSGDGWKSEGVWRSKEKMRVVLGRKNEGGGRSADASRGEEGRELVFAKRSRACENRVDKGLAGAMMGAENTMNGRGCPRGHQNTRSPIHLVYHPSQQ